MKIDISRSSLALPDLITPTSYWLGHLPFAFWLMEHFRPATFVELGVHTGASYCAFCQAVRDLDLPTKCYGIDTFTGDAHYGSYSSEVLTTLLNYHQPRYAAFSRIIQSEFTKAKDGFDDGTIDLLHIDGTHFYQDVRQDFEDWLPKMSAKGIILFHDTNVHERDFGVHRLWAELTGKYRGFEFLHCNGLGVLFLGGDYPGSLDPLLSGSEEDRNAVRDLFQTLGARCEEHAAAITAREETRRIAAAADYHRNENAALRTELQSCNKDREWLRGQKEIAERERVEARNTLNHLLSIATDLRVEAAAPGGLFTARRATKVARRHLHLLDEWRTLHARSVDATDFAAHLSQGAWKSALRAIGRIRRFHLLKPLVRREFFSQVRSIAETADNLLFEDPVAATQRYLDATRAVADHFARQRKSLWKRAIISGRTLDSLRLSIKAVERVIGAAPGGLDDDETASTSRLSRLETKYPGITVPRAIANARSLKTRMRVPATRWSEETGRPRMNFLFPDLDPDIVFGGYIAALEFAAAMGRSYDIRLITTAYPLVPPDALRAKFKTNPRIHGMLEAAEFADLMSADAVLPVSARDFFCAYSFWDGITAHHLAKATGRAEFISFCQEDESSFHAHDYGHATARYSQSLPQFAVFNTTILQDYFRRNSLGVYRHGPEAGDARSTAFQHALVPTKPARPEDYAARKTKRILVYARPEDHAKRNLFEFTLLALDRFLRDEGIAPGDVELVGVGTLEFESELPVGDGHSLKIRPKLEIGDYATSLAGFDIGLSLMYAPHPSILPFEMAAAGLVVVTNTFGSRDETVLTAISGNIVPVEPSIDAIAAGLATAWQRCEDHNARIRHAEFPWSRDWTESFSPAVMAPIDKAVASILASRQSASH